MTGEELDPVRQLEQLLQARVEAGRALDSLAREVGPRSVADQERVTGDHEPGLVSPGAVDHIEAAMLGPVPGRVQDADHDLAQRDLLSVLERLVRELGLRRRMDVNR